MSLLGPSGCGKTTTLRLIAGFETPDHGAIRIGGRDMAGRRPYERNVGLVFQDYALFPHMTVAENVAYGMRQRGVARPEIADRVRRRLEQVRLVGFERRRPSQLSAGASSSASRWPGPWPPSPRSCCWTSPCRTWMRSCVRSCGSS